MRPYGDLADKIERGEASASDVVVLFGAAGANVFGSIDAAVGLLPKGGVWRRYTDQSASVYAASPYNANAQVRYDGQSPHVTDAIVAAVCRMKSAQAKEPPPFPRTPSGSSPSPESDSADHLGVVIGRKDTTR